MTKNREIAEFIFSKMKEYGYEPYDINYGNGYFIFDMGDNSVVHFRVKKLWKHWKFGMWINSDALNYDEEKKKEYNIVSVFAQYDTCIDKFKPSRSELCVEFKAEDWNEEEQDNGLYAFELKCMLDMMRNHPFICYNGYCGKDPGFTRRKSFIWGFVYYESLWLRKKIIKAAQTAWWLPYTKAKIFFAKQNKYVKSIELYNFEKENPGWSTDYLYQVRPTFTAESTADNEVKWLNKWFKRDKYGKYDRYDCVIEVGYLHRDGKNEAYSYGCDD